MKLKNVLLIGIPLIIIAGAGYYFYKKSIKKLKAGKKVREGVLYVKR